MMIAFPYRPLRIILRTVPICPKPESVGLQNIPDDGPTILVYNHLTRRGEPVYLGMAAPSKPSIRFLAEGIIASPEYSSKLREEVEEAIFTPSYREKVKKKRLAGYFYAKFIGLLTRYVIAQANMLKVIVVNLDDPATEEEWLRKRKINKEAFLECIKSLENNIPLAIAPSGGKTSDTVEIPIYQTIVPTLASALYKRGKVAKIVPCVVKENPMIDKITYWQYVADRIVLFRAVKWLAHRLRKKRFTRPRLTIEFLPPLTFEKANSSKSEKTEFVKNLQKKIFDALNR